MSTTYYCPCCSEHRDSCFNVDESTLPDGADKNVTITDIEMCFCSTDRCSHNPCKHNISRLHLPLANMPSLLANIHAIRHDVTVSNWANLQSIQKFVAHKLFDMESHW